MLTENQIMQTWKNSEPILVSITSIAYNQENYIKDAIHGFLIQETNFPFEIIIHDDASSDNTAKIIKEYAEQYPKLIKPIFQITNQHSQGANVQSIPVKYAKGKYVALCDGDDYWIDPHKLQKQIDALREYPTCQICFHSSREIISDNADFTSNILAQHTNQNKLFTTKDIILGDGGFCPTPSLILNKRVFDTLPAWFYNAPIGDYFLQILASYAGGALYLNEPMTAYRRNAIGSWSQQINDLNFLLDWHQRLIQSMDYANEHTMKEFNKEFTTMQKRFNSWIIKNKKIPVNKRHEIFKTYNNKISIKEKFFWFCVYQFL